MAGRRNFLKTLAASTSLLLSSRFLTACSSVSKSSEKGEFPSFITLGAFKGMPIKATFLDEISWDIPHQNWGVKEWDDDSRL